MTYALLFILGVVVGAGLAIAIAAMNRKAADRQMRETFTALAGEALDGNSRRLMELLDSTGRRMTEILDGSGKRLSDAAAAQLDGKKALIDQSVAAVAERLELMRQFIQGLEAQRQNEFGQLTSSVTSLSQTAGELHKMLASTQRRGAWGERMAEDVLRLAGLQEGVNYVKQSTADAENGRADFTFLLPNGLKANMDVKFPLEKYKAFLDAASDADRAGHLTGLCQAVRGHIRAVAGRGYIDPKVPTVPYVIVFIPSEQIFSLVLSCQADLIDDALRQRVVLASPLTLYAKLAIMRQAAENFNIMKTADEVIELLGQFHRQWQKYNEEMDKLGRQIEAAGNQFQTVRTTRSNMLQKPLDRIEDLRQARGLPGKDETG